MKKILHLTMVCLMVFMAACSNDEPTPPAENAIENAAKKLNGLFTCKYAVAGNPITDVLEFSPFSELKKIGTSQVYGVLRCKNSTISTTYESYFYTFTFAYEKLYLDIVNDEGTVVINYIISDIKEKSFHLRHIDMDEDSFMVFIRS